MNAKRPLCERHAAVGSFVVFRCAGSIHRRTGMSKVVGALVNAPGTTIDVSILQRVKRTFDKQK
jgi:hypothetical protein